MKTLLDVLKAKRLLAQAQPARFPSSRRNLYFSAAEQSVCGAGPLVPAYKIRPGHLFYIIKPVYQVVKYICHDVGGREPMGNTQAA